MLETKGLYKVYKPKKGVPVTALRDVNICFPDKGMVFLLGKSGSGKSTLLNVLGGLDRYDQGEIIIKGVSSRDFRQQHFDSYRNTYVGFIFQEYNVLEEFTVGANIALALQLQGKKATDAAVNAILEEVDLAGFGNRRPNELSGGQKQRVAIARALVKNPEIIMADEPTGALDSTTGRQVLETLKRLSAERLVIVVSHDREFAERYADRIIELADGYVIRDVERCGEALPAAEPLAFGEEGIAVEAGYRLTEEDRLAINDYLAALERGEVMLRPAGKAGAEFKATDVSKISRRRGEGFKLIKSKLPMRNAFKIGAGALKYKKIRLTVTILLSCVAFGLFGLSDTFGAYNHIETCTESMIDSNITYTSVYKQKKTTVGNDYFWRELSTALTDADLQAFEEATGVHLKGVSSMDMGLVFESQIGPEMDYTLYTSSFSGFAAITEADLKAMDYPLLAGRLPEGLKNEIAISAYLAESFVKGGYRAAEDAELQKIAEPKDLLNKTITLNETDYTVVGIVDTKLDLERYQPLLEEDENRTTAEELVLYALERELTYASQYSLAQVAMVSGETYEALMTAQPPLRRPDNGHIWYYNEDYNLDPFKIGKLSDLPADEILWLEGERSQLAENEIIITSDLINGAAYYDYGTEIIADPGEGYTDQQTLLEDARALGTFHSSCYFIETGDQLMEEESKVVGIIDVDTKDSRYFGAIILPDSLYSKLTEEGDYDFAVGGTPEDRSALKAMVRYCYTAQEGTRLPLRNSVTYELDTVHDVLLKAADIFLYIGLGFALFAALMLANFISTSISYKKQEIGILRAIGSRSSDVFRIFFSESFIIAMINFVLSCIGVGVATALVNWIIRQNGILITVLHFGIRQILLLLAVSILVAALASFFPVKRIASKRPIDAIRNR